jgi:hypothetical protein
MAIWNLLQTFGIFYGHFGELAVIWYISPCFGILYLKKSGNPASHINRPLRTVPMYVHMSAIVVH